MYAYHGRRKHLASSSKIVMRSRFLYFECSTPALPQQPHPDTEKADRKHVRFQHMAYTLQEPSDELRDEDQLYHPILKPCESRGCRSTRDPRCSKASYSGRAAGGGATLPERSSLWRFKHGGARGVESAQNITKLNSRRATRARHLPILERNAAFSTAYSTIGAHMALKMCNQAET